MVLFAKKGDVFTKFAKISLETQVNHQVPDVEATTYDITNSEVFEVLIVVIKIKQVGATVKEKITLRPTLQTQRWAFILALASETGDSWAGSSP